MRDPRAQRRRERTVPNVAVTVETKGAKAGDGVTAFGQKSDDSRLADPSGRSGSSTRSPTAATPPTPTPGRSARSRRGQTKTFEWKLTAVEPGSYTLDYRVSPGLDGKAKLASGGTTRGSFTVRVDDKPVPARVNSKGEVVRGEEAGAGKD